MTTPARADPAIRVDGRTYVRVRRDQVTVSVVIPAYDAAPFIERALDSVCAQTRPADETIVVNDGSTDETAAVASGYFARYRMNGRVLSQENRGMAAARNVGMRAASGAYIALLDSDDLWYPTKLATVARELTAYPAADLICHNENIRRDGTIIRMSHRRLPDGNVYEALLFDGNLLSPSAVVVRREAALAIGGFDERREYLTVEDYDFWMRFSRRFSIRFIDDVLGEYVLHERSASRRIVFHHANLEGMLRDHMDVYLRSHPNPMARLRVRRRLAQVYRSAVRQLVMYGERGRDQRELVGRMLRTYPFELRNIAVALLWASTALRRPIEAASLRG